ncbi:MAG: hypothetical protein C4547_15985 [Phycisphaerales bacterium]|nr:MAG: hypothetical protein C4547_15985 [Phycisphaerales bacterium]
MKVGDTIKREVKRRGWSILRTSREANTHYASIHAFLTRDADIRLCVLQRLCDALDLELRRKKRRK